MDIPSKTLSRGAKSRIVTGVYFCPAHHQVVDQRAQNKHKEDRTSHSGQDTTVTEWRNERFSFSLDE